MTNDSLVALVANKFSLVKIVGQHHWLHPTLIPYNYY